MTKKLIERWRIEARMRAPVNQRTRAQVYCALVESRNDVHALLKENDRLHGAVVELARLLVRMSEAPPGTDLRGIAQLGLRQSGHTIAESGPSPSDGEPPRE